MIVKKYILQTIQRLDYLYLHTANPEATFYSKLAIIELCGWIELSMDAIVDNFARRKLRTQLYRDIYNSIKRNNNGFVYTEHFRKMLYQTIGIHSMERIESVLRRTPAFDVFQAELENLKTIRNDAAHSYINATKIYQTPSVTRQQLENIYPVLRQIDREIRAL